MVEANGVRRATAEASWLRYLPADRGRTVDGGRFLLTAPLGPIEAEELSWYRTLYQLAFGVVRGSGAAGGGVFAGMGAASL